MTPMSVKYSRRVREHLNFQNRRVVEGPATLDNFSPENSNVHLRKTRTQLDCSRGRHSGQPMRLE